MARDRERVVHTHAVESVIILSLFAPGDAHAARSSQGRGAGPGGSAAEIYTDQVQESLCASLFILRVWILRLHSFEIAGVLYQKKFTEIHLAPQILWI